MSPALIVLAGPTAVGKKECLYNLSEQLPIECVWADSRKVYKYMDIGTAKPRGKEKEILPHHMLDIIEPSERFSAAEFAKDASSCIQKIWKRGNVPILVGGTGLYIKGVVDGLFEGVGAVQELRKKLLSEEQRKGAGYLHTLLQSVDSESAKRIASTDIFRIVRALEVYYTMGKPISWLQRHCTKAPLSCKKLLLLLKEPIPLLYQRIDRRVEQMVREGLLEEVRFLLSLGYGEDAPCFKTIGYKEMLKYIKGECGLDEAISVIKKNTKTLARRQMRWFARDRRWRVFTKKEFGKILSLIKDFLKDEGYILR
jgi:tRNA dimethylallyltransferase